MELVIIFLLLVVCVLLYNRTTSQESWEPLLFVPTIIGGSPCDTVDQTRPASDIALACGAKPFCQWNAQTQTCSRLPAMYPGYKPLI